MNNSNQVFPVIDERARRDFERVVLAEPSADLAPFLPPAEAAVYAATLEELVMIDLEAKWGEHSKRPDSAAPRLEQYVERFPVLSDSASLKRLVEEELRIRSEIADAPDIDEYVRRFPQLDLLDTLTDALDTYPAIKVGDPSTDDGRYSDYRKHAAGGMGVVYRARDNRLERDVAIKCLKHNEICELETRRFINEARLAGRLQHPGIVPIYDLGESPSGPFYAMKMVEGKPFSDLIDEHHTHFSGSPLARRQLLGILVSVAKAVAFAHHQGVIHRDLKPANVVVGNYGEVVVLDWGLAKAATQADQPGASGAAGLSTGSETLAGSVMGTPAYMSPEQSLGKLQSLDSRADVFSLGAMLFHILVGRPHVRTLEEIQQASTSGISIPAICGAHVCPRHWTQSAPKQCPVRPEDRYESADVFAQEVERYLADEPVAAYAEPLVARGMRWIRKNMTLGGQRCGGDRAVVGDRRWDSRFYIPSRRSETRTTIGQEPCGGGERHGSRLGGGSHRPF